MTMRLKLYTLLCASFLFLFTSCNQDDDPVPPEAGSKTVLVYIVADNSLASFAKEDVEEMIEGMKLVGSSSCNLLVYQDDRNTPVLFRIAKDKKGNVIYDTETKDTEIVAWNTNIDDYMEREVLPHVPDAKAFFEEDLAKKNPVIKTGAEIPFTRYFYKYQAPVSSDELAKRFNELEASVDLRIKRLFGGN